MILRLCHDYGLSDLINGRRTVISFIILWFRTYCLFFSFKHFDNVFCVFCRSYVVREIRLCSGLWNADESINSLRTILCKCGGQCMHWCTHGVWLNLCTFPSHDGHKVHICQCKNMYLGFVQTFIYIRLHAFVIRLPRKVYYSKRSSVLYLHFQRYVLVLVVNKIINFVAVSFVRFYLFEIILTVSNTWYKTNESCTVMLEHRRDL